MLDSPTTEMLALYNEGMELYKQRKFSEAKVKFEGALAKRPDDGPCQLYINRCDEYIKLPPPDDWDGVFTMTTK